MISHKLEQVFKNRSFWQNAINPHLQNLAENQYRNTMWWNSQSRTLQQALNNTLSGYSGSIGKAYKILLAACSLLNENRILKLYPKYALISSEQAENLTETLTHILDMPTPDSTAFNMYLYHIPKGKSYLRKVLDEDNSLNRLKPIETVCIENTQHFIRVYRNFNNTGNNSITVFSDQYTPDLINTLFVMLPHLMGIVSREATEEYTLTEEDVKYNNKVEKLYDIFKILYQIMQEGANNLRSYTDADFARLTEQFQTITTEYANAFDFIHTQLNTFIERLAAARNNNAQRHYTNQLSNITHKIQELEETLRQKYIDKAKFSRALIAHKLLNTDDVKPFIETIQNTKAIEILSTTDSKMVVRVTAPLQYFQENDFTAYENNAQSIYRQRFYNLTTLKKVLHKVFVTREYKLLVQAIIHIDIQDNYNNSPLYLFAERQNDTSSFAFTQFPNPHLYHYNCWGAAQSEMQKNMCEGNFELVIMQMVAAVQSVNIAENASFVNGFLSDVQNSSKLRDLMTFIVDTSDGTKTMTYSQIIDYENNLEKQNAIQQAQQIIAQAPKQEYTQVEIPDDDNNWDSPAERFERQHAEDIANEEGEDENEEN